jgi:DNA-binding NarL/FixJ family response regulator
MNNNFIIASPNREKILSWMQGLKGFVRTSVITDSLQVLWDELVRIEPDVLLLDIDLIGSNNPGSADNLGRLCTKTSVVILSSDISEDMECELLKAGVRGCCNLNLDPEQIKHVVILVQQGELWIRRTLTSRLVSELGDITSKNMVYRASHELLKRLTHREYDIAIQVGNGLSNKEIAISCAITERTVKAHLSEIFHKLGVTDRINLALMMSEDHLHQLNDDLPINDNNSLN